VGKDAWTIAAASNSNVHNTQGERIIAKIETQSTKAQSHSKRKIEQQEARLRDGHGKGGDGSGGSGSGTNAGHDQRAKKTAPAPLVVALLWGLKPWSYYTFEARAGIRLGDAAITLGGSAGIPTAGTDENGVMWGQWGHGTALQQVEIYTYGPPQVPSA
jgi:hypothetical protein